MTGTSRYVSKLGPALRDLGTEPRMLAPALPSLPWPVFHLTRRSGIDLETFFAHYPVRLERADVDVYHLTSQNLATLLMLRHFDRPVVVTVHDIVPYLVRRDRRLNTYRHPLHRWFDDLAVRGLRRADALIADSSWTRETLGSALGIAAERIHVVYLGVDHAVYRPLDVPADARQRYGLAAEHRYVLYVGSEDPRKNVDTLLRAFGQLAAEHPNLRLLKVGAPRYQDERRRLQDFATSLGIGGAIQWLDHVPEADLVMLYNQADVLVLPSFYEGFGFPALEAMACGRPVVAADAASLPEVVGEAGLLFDPRDPSALATAVSRVLAEPDLRARLACEGRERARQFTWDRAAAQTSSVYLAVGERPQVARGISGRGPKSFRPWSR